MRNLVDAVDLVGQGSSGCRSGSPGEMADARDLVGKGSGGGPVGAGDPAGVVSSSWEVL